MNDIFSSPLRPGHDGIVLQNGLLALADSTLTPREAFLEDLAFVRAVLEGSGIDFFLVRGSDDRPVIVVDWRNREALTVALATACRSEPFYAKTEKLTKAAKADIAARSRGIASGAIPPRSSLTADDILYSDENQPDPAPVSAADEALAGRQKGRRVLLAEGLLSRRPGARGFTLYRPRTAPRGHLAYAADAGVPLELWEYSDDKSTAADAAVLVIDDVIAPRPNVLLRHRTPQSELVRDTVELFGEQWPTLAGMFDTVVEDVGFDIDLVFSWVDGSQLEWQRARARRMASYVVGEGDDHEARFRQLDELKYALRSVNLFAPWVRNIYIVTDSPRPAWLAEHPRVTILPSEEFFADTSVLPTHNSHAVESQLHNIDGLSEHFLYSNDDMFFGRPVAPGMFFSSGGVSKFIQSNTRIGIGASNPARSGFENAARVNRALLLRRFGTTITRHLEHAATPLRRSVLRELEAEFPADFARTAASAFRQATDISVTNSLYHYFALITGRAVIQTDARVRYVDTTARQGVSDMKRLLKRRDYDFFCLNDGSFPELDAEERANAVHWFLERYFPVAAPWEIEQVEPVADASVEDAVG
jgi:hypothetical protein